jgi:hypothetical protein
MAESRNLKTKREYARKYSGKEEAKHKVLRCLETKGWRIKFLCKKWSNMIEELV